MRICSLCKIKPNFLDRIVLSNAMSVDSYECPSCHQVTLYRSISDWLPPRNRDFVKEEERTELRKDLSQAMKKYKRNYPKI